MHPSVTIGLAQDVAVELRCADRDGPPALHGPARDFVHAGPPTLSLTVHHGPLPPLPDAAPLLNLAGSWRVFRDRDRHLIVLLSGDGQIPYEVAIIDFAAGQGELHLADARGAEVTYPFEFPLAELVFSRLLADRRGLIVHAGGARIFGRGVLFAGQSGAGKSTLAELIAARDETRILSDDRVAVTLGGKVARISGTPWHGTARFASPESQDLHCVLLLQHAGLNELRRLTPGEAAARLLALAVVPYWDEAASSLCIDTAARLAEAVPAYELGFVPDSSAVDHVRQILGNNA